MIVLAVTGWLSLMELTVYEYNCALSNVSESKVVIDEDTAISISANAIEDATGHSSKYDEPFSAELKGRVWTVRGSHPEGATGGPSIVVIDAYTGCIISIDIPA